LAANLQWVEGARINAKQSWSAAQMDLEWINSGEAMDGDREKAQLRWVFCP